MQNFNGIRQLGGGNTSCIELLAIEIQYLILEFINPLSALRLAHTSRKLYCVVRHNDAIWRQRYEKSYIPESDLEADLPRLLNRTNIETLSWFDINVRRELIEKRWRKGTLAASASITSFPDVPIAQLLLEAPDVCVTTEYTAVSCQNRLFFKSLHLEQWREIHLPGYHHRYNEAPIPSQVQSETNYTPETIADNRSRTLLGAFHLRGPFLLAYIWGRTRQCKLCVWDLRYVAAEIDCSLACKPLARYSGYTSILAGNYLATEEKDSTTSRMQVRDLAAAARRVPYNRPFCSNDPEVRQLVWPAGLTSFGHCHDVDDRHEPVLLCVGNRQPTKEVPTTLSTLERALWISTADLISPPSNSKDRDENVIWWRSPVKVSLNEQPCWDVARFAAGYEDQLILSCRISTQHDRRTPMGFVLVCCSLFSGKHIWCRDEPSNICELFSFRAANRLVAATTNHCIRIFNLKTGALLQELVPEIFANQPQHYPITLHRVIGNLLAITFHGDMFINNNATKTVGQLRLAMMDVADGRILWRKTLAQSSEHNNNANVARNRYQCDYPTEAAFCATRLCVYRPDINGIFEMDFARNLI